MADAAKILSVARRIGKVKDSGVEIVSVVSAMGDTTDELVRLAETVSSEPDPREMDLLLSTGELVACTLMTMALRTLGYSAISLSGFQAGIHTDAAHGKARIDRIDTARVKKELAKGQVIVVAGFQGITEDQDITTLGRGASDTTAVALAAALGAERCEIYTDVEGIYSADPKLVPGARKLAEIGYREMMELASYGAKMHPRSIDLGRYYHVPIYVSSSFSDAPGTLIHQGPDDQPMENRVKIAGITCDTNVAKITVRSVPDRPGIAAAIFEPLAEAGMSVDTIVQNASLDRTTDISFTVSRGDLPDALRQVERVLGAIGAPEMASDSSLASVNIVGSGMQDTPGYAARMFRILADGNINIDMITTSEIRISCIIKEEQVEEAVRLLHRGFELEEAP